MIHARRRDGGNMTPTAAPPAEAGTLLPLLTAEEFVRLYPKHRVELVDAGGTSLTGPSVIVRRAGEQHLDSGIHDDARVRDPERVPAAQGVGAAELVPQGERALRIRIDQQARLAGLDLRREVGSEGAFPRASLPRRENNNVHTSASRLTPGR